MPKYVLDTYECDWLESVDEFTLGYITAMFFADIDTPDLDTDGMAPRDLSFTSAARIIFECQRFQRKQKAKLDAAYAKGYSVYQAGSDFWFSRVGHGVGYWDRGLGELGDDLHSEAQVEGERNVYLADDGALEYV